MMTTGQTIAWCAGVGVATGIISPLCGVGGGIIMVPAFALILGLEQKSAVGTSLVVMILTAAVATYKNVHNNFVDWRVAVPTAIASAVVAWFASARLKELSNPLLTRMFAILVIVMGVQMLWQSRRPSQAIPEINATGIEAAPSETPKRVE